MFIEQLEIDIEKQLRAKIGTGIDVEVMPETEAGFSRPFAKGRLSVCYKQSEFDKPRSTAEISQDEEQTIEVIIQSRTLRKTHGIYDLAERTRKALVGFMPKHCRRIYAVSFKFESRETNLWVYVYTFATRSTIVEVEVPDTEPLITQVTGESGFNTSVVTN